MRLRQFKNRAPQQVLLVAVDADDNALEVTSTADYPPPPFALTLARATPEEEIVLCTALDSNTFSVERAYDGTAATSHGPGTLIEHSSVASDYREAGIARLTTAERDALSAENDWEGRVIFNETEKRIEVRQADDVWASILPAGVILPYGGTDAPPGFLLCNGSAVSRAGYPALFAVLGTSYGAGDGSTTFGLPDFRGRLPLGVTAAGGLMGTTPADVRGAKGGSLNHDHTGPSHTHTGPSHSHTTPNHAHDLDNSASSGGGGATSVLAGHAHSVADTDAQGAHAHTFSDSGSDSFGTGGPSYSQGSLAIGGGSTTSAAGTGHTHSGSVSVGVSGTTSTYGAHAHNVGATSTSATHSHTIPHHVHDLGATVSGGGGTTAASGTAATGASGTAVTGDANPPMLTVNYIVRY